jgi:SAM-dependent methyltransferase
MMPTALFRPSPRADLARRLARLARVFPIDVMARAAMGPSDAASYYEACFDAYRRHHSSEGAVHMALNDGGRFDAAGFEGQLHRLAAAWRREAPRDVLELAFGQGFNLAWLAPRFAGVRFEGLDLTPRHVAHVRSLLDERGIGNVVLREGDFHHLPQADGSFDQVFCIEALCYALDTPGVLAGIARVLRPGGALTLFDGYLSRPLDALDAEEALAIRLVAKGMAIDRFQVIDEIVAQAAAVGLVAERNDTLDAQIMPSLRRLERITGAVVRWPWLGRKALARRHPMRGRNVLAGYLMRPMVTLGLLTYRHLVLRKPAAAPT